jgi:hypothetical protein
LLAQAKLGQKRPQEEKIASAGQVFAELQGGGGIDKAKVRNYSWRGNYE